MPQLTRRYLVRWLLNHGFEELPGKKSGHRQFGGHGIKISVPGHGPEDFTTKHAALIMRQLVGAGFDRETVRRDLLGAGRKSDPPSPASIR